MFGRRTHIFRGRRQKTGRIGLSAAVVYTCLRGGVDVADAVVTMRVGDRGRQEDVALRLRPAARG